MIIADVSILNVALPSIAADLGITYTEAEWTNAGYSLMFAAFLIAFGRAGDKVGRKRMFLIGICVFMGASMLAGFAQSGSELLAARLVQGLGGAMILPASLSTLSATFRGRDRAIAFAIWGSTIGGMGALGPLLAGVLTTELSWRWVFFINLPVGFLAFAGAWLLVTETRDAHAVAGFDVPGTALLAAGLGLLVFGLIEGQTYGWRESKRTLAIGSLEWPFQEVSPILCALVASVPLLALFVVTERRRQRRGVATLVDFRLFEIGSFRYGNIAVAIVSLGEFGLIFVIPLFLQFVLGYSALESGAVLALIAVGAFSVGPFAGRFAHRFGSRTVVRTGMVLEAVGIFCIGLVIAVDMTWWELVAPFLVYGVGIGLATAQLTSVVLVDVPPAQAGAGSGIQGTSRQVGSALGIAILGTSLAVLFTNGVEDRIAASALPPTAQAALVDAASRSGGAAIAFAAANPVAARAVPALEQSFAVASRRVAFIAAGFVLLGVLASLLLPESRPYAEDSERLPAEL